MSSIHSRSSSEVDTTPYGEVLPVFFKVFQKDFDFKDAEERIRETMMVSDIDFKDVKERRREILLKSEYDYIAKETGDAQIRHLLWVLENKSDNFILKFLDIINYDYKWIVDEIKMQLHDHSMETTRYLEKLKRTQFEYQQHTDFNVHRTKPFISLRRALRKLNPKRRLASVVLLGELGSGKKWLALDVCSDFDVLKSMNFKIFWLDCINCVAPDEDFKLLNTLMSKLKPSHQSLECPYPSMLSYMIKTLKEQIIQQLESKAFHNCLLVLANVQNVKCAKVFNLGCKSLIITRNKKVSESLSTKLNIHLTLDEGLNINEFHLLLDKYIKSYNWRKDNANDATDIFHMSKGDPYMLNIIAQKFQEKKSNWLEWKRNLYNLRIPDPKFERDIKKSLEILTPELLQLYATLAIFPYCAQIPVKILAFLWNMDLHRAEYIIKKLHINSFLKKETLDDNDTIVCSLKYVYSSYIKYTPEIQKLINPEELHRKIIEYYDVEENLEVRKDVNLFFGDQHNCYFFRYVGYHLYGAGYKNLFPKLYVDFGFLGQQMRNVGLANIMADFRDYKTDILQGDITGQLLEKLKAFLIKIEEKILHANDCCLLQYALMAEEPIRELALQQIQKFPYRVWFSESGQFHQRRFIISLTNCAKLTRVLENDICVVVLFNNATFLVDISVDSICMPVHLIDASTASITDIKTFDDNNYLLTLDNYGNLNLRKIKEEKRQILVQRADASVDFNPNNYKLCPKQTSSRPFKKSIDVRTGEKIVAFSMEILNASKYVLHVALDNGIVRHFDWNPKLENFEHNYIYTPTHIKNIHSVCKINSHYMIMNYSGNTTSMNVTFINLRNTAKEHINGKWPENTQLIHYEVFNYSIILVFTNCVLRLNLQFKPFNAVQEDVLYESKHVKINCAKLCWENQYLVLGTEKGLVVFNINNRHVEILTSIVSENVSCVDNYDLDDKEYRTMIVCGIKNKNIMYIFGLRGKGLRGNDLVWDHSYSNSEEEEKNTRFLGDKLFVINRDGETLYAVDSKNRIHQICCMETKNWSIIPLPDTNRKITAISAFNNSVLVAVEDGQVFDLHQQRCVVTLPNQNAAVQYFKMINDNILICSTFNKTCITHIENAKYTTVEIFTKYCAMVMDKYLLIVNNYGGTMFYNTEKKFLLNNGIHQLYPLADCDLKDNVLFLGFSNNLVHIYSLKETDSGIECQQRCEIRNDGKDCTITCLTASSNAKMFAIAINTTQPLISFGDIEVFKLDDSNKVELLYCLKSHASPVYDMMFSPHNDILVSISELICFWNINYIINNPLNVSNTKRHSSRFNSQKSTEEVDAQVLCNNRQRNNRFLSLETLPSKQSNCSDPTLCLLDAANDDVFETNDSIWSLFRGPEDKPELLSCIKLDGSVAKQIFTNRNFTQFYTIDDQGVYYNLKLIKPARQISPDSVDFSESSLSSRDTANANNFYIQRLSIASTSTTSGGGTDVVDDVST